MERMLLKPSEVQRELGIGRSKVYEMLASGELPCIAIGRLKRVPAKALEEWIEKQKEEAR